MRRDDGTDVPNPGSAAAVEAGCSCPVLDNAHGVYPPHGEDSWWIDLGCRIHAPGVTFGRGPAAWQRDVTDVIGDL